MIEYEHARPARFERIVYRSRTEALWAGIFRVGGIGVMYEPEGFEFPDGTRYVPDFYIRARERFVEVKNGNMLVSDVAKINGLARHLGAWTALIDGALAKHRPTMVYVFDGRTARSGFERADELADHLAVKTVRATHAAAAFAALTLPGPGQREIGGWSANYVNNKVKAVPYAVDSAEPVTLDEQTELAAKLRNYPYKRLGLAAAEAAVDLQNTTDSTNLLFPPEEKPDSSY
jgi:hypothetical protein